MNRLSFASIAIATLSHAATFPGTLTEGDIEDVNAKLSGVMQERAWTHGSDRSPQDGVDFSFGIESSLTFDTAINQYGDKTGSVPSAMPVPKLYGALHLPNDIHVSASLFPGSSIVGVTTYGAAAEWFFFRDRKFLNYSVLAHYSHSDLFGDYSANTQGMQLAANHEFHDFTLYAGAGFISVDSHVNSTLLAPGTEDRYYGSVQSHVVLGSKILWEFPVSLQAELIGTQFNMGLLIAKDF